MAVNLIKLVMSATTNTTAAPTAYGYYNTLTAAVTTTKLFIAKSKFLKDNGSAASTIVVKSTDNGYYSLFVNGSLQQTGLYTVAASGVTISDTPAFSIPLSAPITLTVTNFDPVSSTVVTA